MDVLQALAIRYVQEGRYYLETVDGVKYQFTPEGVLERTLSYAHRHTGFTWRVEDLRAKCKLMPVEGRAHSVFRYVTEEALRAAHGTDCFLEFHSGPVYKYQGVERLEAHLGHGDCIGINMANPADIIDVNMVIPGERTQYGFAYLEEVNSLDAMHVGFRDGVVLDADP